MSDEWGQEGGAALEAASDGPTAGALLRQAREAQGLHVAALAVALKVPVRKVEALEDDRYDLMTDSVFVRGLAASVCRTLKIDPQPILARLPQTTAPRLVRDNDGINTPFRAPSDGPPVKWTGQVTKPVYLIVFALLLGAGVLVFVPVTLRDESAKATGRFEPTPAPAEPAPPVVVPIAAEPAPALVAVASMPAPVAAKPELEPAPAPAPVVAPAPVAASPAAVAAAPFSSAPAASGVVVIRATGPSWVEITDAKGTVPVRKMLAAGESAVANGPLPIHVIVGRSDMTQVLVRGKPFDLKPFTRSDNLARFDVK